MCSLFDAVVCRHSRLLQLNPLGLAGLVGTPHPLDLPLPLPHLGLRKGHTKAGDTCGSEIGRRLSNQSRETGDTRAKVHLRTHTALLDETKTVTRLNGSGNTGTAVVQFTPCQSCIRSIPVRAYRRPSPASACLPRPSVRSWPPFPAEPAFQPSATSCASCGGPAGHKSKKTHTKKKKGKPKGGGRTQDPRANKTRQRQTSLPRRDAMRCDAHPPPGATKRTRRISP